MKRFLTYVSGAQPSGPAGWLAVLNAAGLGKNLPDAAITARIKAIKGPLHLRTFVSLTCTHCDGPYYVGKGVYAAGDVTDVPYKQVVIAMGEGGKAALSAFLDFMRGELA